MGSLPRKPFDVKKVAIIGAGPCGLCAAKYLRAQGSVESIAIYEQQAEVGGIWNYVGLPSKRNPVPQEDPFYPPDAPVGVQPEGAPIFPTPMYDRLHANIPEPLMRFSDQDFAEEDRLFPERKAIQEYIVKYSADVRHLIRFCYQVKKVSPTNQGDQVKWTLEARSTTGDETLIETFDAVVVANGHYSIPFLPHVRNITQFHEAHPSVIIHSKNYRQPDIYRNQKVVVIGNGPSGIDIAAQIGEVAQRPLLLSVRHATPPDKLAHIGCKEIAEIDEFLADTRGIRCKDGSVENDIDVIIYCTGFLYSYPFLPDLEDQLIQGGLGVHNLYKHLFMVQYPTLVFPALNIKSTPWQLCEAQCAVFSAVWDNQIELPSLEEMKAWSKALEDKLGDKLHVFGPLEDGQYINEMHDWAMQAPHLGKQPPRWNEELFWLRSIFQEVKMRFEEEGCKAKTVEDLGLSYQPSEQV